MSQQVDIAQHQFNSPKFSSIVREAADFFANTPDQWLPPEKFSGAGVYAIYYRGDFAPYKTLSALNSDSLKIPIYVGKAVPQGWRTGRVAGIDAGSLNLHGRLREHATSIRLAENLKIEDFPCRFMILGGAETDLISPVEAELIRLYRPLWNHVMAGFGIHAPGKGRYDQARSEWDVLHPGRGFAARLTGQAIEQHIIENKIHLYMEALQKAEIK